MGHTYERTIQVNLERFVASWGPVSWRDQIAGARPAPNAYLARLFHALSRIEDEAFLMQIKIRAVGASCYSAIREFNAIWLAEESEHSRALAALSDRYGGVGDWRPGPSVNISRRRLALALPRLFLIRTLPRESVLATYLSLGALQEYVALTTYNAAAELVGDDEPARLLLAAISRQEGRHMRFYRSGAEAILHESSISRTIVRIAAAHFWQPPGLDLLGFHTWCDTFLPLLEMPDVMEKFKRLDAVAGNLLGLEGIAIMTRFLEQSAVREKLPNHREGVLDLLVKDERIDY